MHAAQSSKSADSTTPCSLRTFVFHPYCFASCAQLPLPGTEVDKAKPYTSLRLPCVRSSLCGSSSLAERHVSPDFASLSPCRHIVPLHRSLNTSPVLLAPSVIHLVTLVSLAVSPCLPCPFPPYRCRALEAELATPVICPRRLR